MQRTSAMIHKQDMPLFAQTGHAHLVTRYGLRWGCNFKLNEIWDGQVAHPDLFTRITAIPPTESLRWLSVTTTPIQQDLQRVEQSHSLYQIIPYK